MKIDTGIFALPAHNPSFGAIRAVAGPGADLLDFCVPVNPYFPPDTLLDDLRAHLDDLVRHYPDYAGIHQQRLAQWLGVPAANIVVGNGSTEIITLLSLTAQGPVATSVPTFGRWTDLPLERGIGLAPIERRAANGFRLDPATVIDRVRQARARTLVLSNPNNPTGALFEPEDLSRIVDELRDLPLIVVDESFIDFSGIASAQDLAMANDNVVVVKSLGKSLGMHGIRLGYAIASEATARDLRRRTPYWNVNAIASRVLELLPAHAQALRESFARAAADRESMLRRLQRIDGLAVYPSRANFLYCLLPPGTSGRDVRDRLLAEHRIVVRECGNKLGSTPNHLRLAVHPPATAGRLADALEEVLASTPTHRSDA